MVVSLVTGANRWVLVTATLALLTTARCFSVSVVCGANRGIGLELCRQLKAKGENVVAVCRKTSPQLDGLGVHRVIEGVDVSEDSQVATLTDKLSGESIHQLWCNAGVLSVESLEDMDFDRIRRQFEINTLGPLRVVKALLPNLQRGSKVLIMTSRMGSIDDNTSGGYYGYRMSKTAVNSAAKSLALDLKPRGVSVALLHPGWVRTDMTSRHGDAPGMIEPSQSVKGLIAVADELTLDSTGTFFHMNGERLPW